MMNQQPNQSIPNLQNNSLQNNVGQLTSGVTYQCVQNGQVVPGAFQFMPNSLPQSAFSTGSIPNPFDYNFCPPSTEGAASTLTVPTTVISSVPSAQLISDSNVFSSSNSAPMYHDNQGGFVYVPKTTGAPICSVSTSIGDSTSVNVIRNID